MRARRPRDGRPVALIVTPKFLPFLGGMERECALLGAEFARRGYRPVVITEQLGTAGPRRETLGDIDVLRIPSSPRRSLRTQLVVALRIALVVLRHRQTARFAIVRTATLPAVLVGLLKAVRLIRLPTLMTAETGGAEDDVVALSRRPFFMLTRRLVSCHDVLNGICQTNVDHLHEHGFPSSRITFIPNGIDTSAWERTAPPARIRRFLFLGRIEPLKGVFELADAFAVVSQDHPDASLILAGEGPSEGELRERCEELGISERVTFRGRVAYEDLGTLFDSIDCLVLPSYSEGMPLSVLEAAAHHRPLIVTDVGDMKALFGDRIRICSPRDGEELRAQLEAALEDPSPRADYDDVIQRVAIASVAEAMLARLQP